MNLIEWRRVEPYAFTLSQRSRLGLIRRSCRFLGETVATEFKISNNIKFQIDDEGPEHEGICAGMTTQWCRRRLQGLRKEAAKPDLNESRDLEIDYLKAVGETKGMKGLIGIRDKIVQYFARAGLKIKDADALDVAFFRDEKGNNIPKYVKALPNVAHWIGIPASKTVKGSVGHVVGAYYSENDGYFFFEPEKGGYRFEDYKDFAFIIRNYYPDRLNVDWWPLFELELGDDSEDGERRTGSKCCYITTATCMALNLPDDCDVLTTLRRFRDDVLMQSIQGRRDVETYYAMAPSVVQQIDASPDAAAIYHGIYELCLAPAVVAIKAGNHELAYELFRSLILNPEPTRLYR
jgi:hypothetical protein